MKQACDKPIGDGRLRERSAERLVYVINNPYIRFFITVSYSNCNVILEPELCLTIIPRARIGSESIAHEAS